MAVGSLRSNSRVSLSGRRRWRGPPTPWPTSSTTTPPQLQAAQHSRQLDRLADFARPGNLGRALAAGVSGFLVKDGPADDLLDAVRRVARGERVFAPPSR
jgi:DNA-binding NarL/FixJ family response regulator